MSRPSSPPGAVRRAFHRAATRGCSRLALGLALTLSLGSGVARADGRDDLKAAYDKAKGQFNNFELEEAQKTLETAIKAAKDENAKDPNLAPLMVLRAGVIWNNTQEEGPTVDAFKEAVTIDYNVKIPVEIRSDELQGMLDKAREGLSAPDEAILYEPPTPTCGEDITFSLLANGLVEGGTVALYWRTAGSEGDPNSVEVDMFGNAGAATIPADEHGDKDIEYFFYLFDGSQKDIGHKGTQDKPIKLELGCVKDEPKPEPKVEPKKVEAKWKLPRFWINLGVGTGFGLAHGEAEQSYQQFDPSSYGLREVACALARWKAGPSDPSPDLADVVGYYSSDPAVQQAVVAAYDQDTCAAHHAVTAGFALAPLHIKPEFGVRVHPKIVLSVFGRLQLVTATSVYRDDPTKTLDASYSEDVRCGADTMTVPGQPPNVNCEGVKKSPGFTAAAGVKVRYFFRNDEKRFRPFIGGFLGGGFARLRVPMGFANDRNGNSIPDDKEQGAAVNAATASCVPIWPYNGGTCDINAPSFDDNVATAIATKADSSQRVDSVRLGPLMVGATGGFNFMIHKNFSLYGELDVGVWFWDAASLLFDVTVGPAITF
ncbi:MAG: hypothetical protein KC636_27315 [Myxococcales bacterium]|nr:hypothetical protein [Myxococcales bacterium]